MEPLEDDKKARRVGNRDRSPKAWMGV